MRAREFPAAVSSFLFTALLPALAEAQPQPPATAPSGPGAGEAAGGSPSPVWWVILGILAVVLIWAIIRAQRRGGAAGGP